MTVCAQQNEAARRIASHRTDMSGIKWMTFLLTVILNFLNTVDVKQKKTTAERKNILSKTLRFRRIEKYIFINSCESHVRRQVGDAVRLIQMEVRSVYCEISIPSCEQTSRLSGAVDVNDTIPCGCSSPSTRNRYDKMTHATENSHLPSVRRINISC